MFLQSVIVHETEHLSLAGRVMMQAHPLDSPYWIFSASLYGVANAGRCRLDALAMPSKSTDRLDDLNSPACCSVRLCPVGDSG